MTPLKEPGRHSRAFSVLGVEVVRQRRLVLPLLARGVIDITFSEGPQPQLRPAAGAGTRIVVFTVELGSAIRGHLLTGEAANLTPEGEAH